MRSNEQSVIEPTRGHLFIDFAALYHYRDLFLALIWREYASKYKKTLLGPLWFILQPLLTTFTFTVVFGKLGQMPTDMIPPALFYFAGIIVWNYFSQCLETISFSFTANETLFQKVYFPRLILPLSTLFSKLIHFFVQLIFFQIVYLYVYFRSTDGFHPNPFLLLFPFVVGLAAMTSLGAGLWFAVLTVKYRDLSQAFSFITQLWMLMTPVIYPLSSVPESWRLFAFINPLTTVLELFRMGCFGGGMVTPLGVLVSLLSSVCLLLSGLFIFGKVERTLMDTI